MQYRLRQSTTHSRRAWYVVEMLTKDAHVLS